MSRYHHVRRDSPKPDVLLVKFPDVIRLVSDEDGVRGGLERGMHDRKRRGEFIGRPVHRLHPRALLYAFGRSGSLLAGVAQPTQHFRKGRNLSSRHVTRRWHAQALSAAIPLSYKAIAEKMEANLKTLLWFCGPPGVITSLRFAMGISRNGNRDGSSPCSLRLCRVSRRCIANN